MKSECHPVYQAGVLGAALRSDADSGFCSALPFRSGQG
jgi:hypothetical protein